ncbi:MAG: nucleotidyltransferase family protein [Bacteroidales bacterium]|nr:nucleotidyltransferase family protein [Bacteroidales bacterium]
MIAFIPAAGLGTRLYPLTADKPKALVDVYGMTMLERRIKNLSAAGFEKFVVNVHHFGDQVIRHLEANSNFGLDITVSDERGLLRDTGGAIKYAAPLLAGPEPFLVHNVDIFSNVDFGRLRETERSSGPGVMAHLLVSERETSRYLLFNEDNRLVGWTNIKTGEVKTPAGAVPDMSKCRRLAFSGIHIVNPKLLDVMKGWPDVFSIIDFYVSICCDFEIRGVEYPGFNMIDLGRPEQIDNLKNSSLWPDYCA